MRLRWHAYTSSCFFTRNSQNLGNTTVLWGVATNETIARLANLLLRNTKALQRLSSLETTRALLPTSRYNLRVHSTIKLRLIPPHDPAVYHMPRRDRAYEYLQRISQGGQYLYARGMDGNEGGRWAFVGPCYVGYGDMVVDEGGAVFIDRGLG